MTDVSTKPHSFIHRFVPARTPDRPPLLLLHGTGGDENDLLPLGEAVSAGAALLSPRGKVLENGMPRFFRRLAEGVFDEADVKARAEELADFVEEARARYGLGRPVALGFSNGANIAAAMLLVRPEVLAGAILLRATVPLVAAAVPALKDKPILLVSGAADPLVPAANAAKLAALFTTAGAALRHETLPVGHGLSQADLSLAGAWLAGLGR
ncbi:alpha/beta hydrolase [Chelatococcus sp. SYSU_G07232]|uniref:Alpha/beta hydrolase n=1 Tax=Chelatococcus albus TaxID=3047466 RepID=A0ABT7AD09_9HYPH|nr:alpha/beta hydrolase [Chelatococcus sp. SYSU_G07232]MDJ1157261.1 alpha/beta hydrolase [Chelatococcus sp. SYSU_G07232]